MIIRLLRRLMTENVTIGDLYIGEHLFCNTLEDTVRTGEKVYGQTAIPSGRYIVKLTYSNRFKRVMPQLMDVPNFSGIRIHSGNTELDTDGCILVGKQQGSRLINSRDTYNDLMDVLEAVKSPEHIEIVIV